MPEIKWKIIKNLGVIGKGGGGWKKEVNVISWNEKKPKVDIRSWDEEHKKMGKGVTFSKEEITALKTLLDSLEVDSIEIE